MQGDANKILRAYKENCHDMFVPKQNCTTIVKQLFSALFGYFCNPEIRASYALCIFAFLLISSATFLNSLKILCMRNCPKHLAQSMGKWQNKAPTQGREVWGSYPHNWNITLQNNNPRFVLIVLSQLNEKNGTYYVFIQKL